VEFTERLKQARERCHLSQQQAATRAGITVQHWGQIERGATRGSDETRAQMARVVRVTPEELEDDGLDILADLVRGATAESETAELTDSPEDDVIMLRTILQKLTPTELRWLVGHLDLFASLGTHNNRRNDPASRTA
jgi:transcriptional regulator with XRE-family HTH domain